ncbi:MAG: hypothetical protein ACJAZO_002110 [Myxococcota bacterium]|jgi:hypothetical protein
MHLFLPVTVALLVNLIPMLHRERTELELATGASVATRMPNKTKY